MIRLEKFIRNENCDDGLIEVSYKNFSIIFLVV